MQPQQRVGIPLPTSPSMKQCTSSLLALAPVTGVTLSLWSVKTLTPHTTFLVGVRTPAYSLLNNLSNVHCLLVRFSPQETNQVSVLKYLAALSLPKAPHQRRGKEGSQNTVSLTTELTLALFALAPRRPPSLPKAAPNS